MLRIIARIGFLLGTLLFAAFFAKSQTYGIPINGLKKVYPNEDVIVYRSKVVYTVDFNKYNVPNAIIEKTEDKYVALQPESHAVDARYYNMYSEISKHRVSGTGIFNPSTSQRCGDYETDGIFYHDAKVCEFYLRFKKAGEYLTVKTTKKYNDPKYFTKILFNQVYAIKYKTVRLELPINIDIELLEMNLEPYDIIKTELIDENSQLKIIEYKISDIPSSHKLENIPGYSCTFPHLLVLFKGYEKSDGQVGLIENTDDLYNWYKSLTTEPTLSLELAAITDQLAQATISDTAKIAAVYYWIQDKIRYLAFENGPAAFVPEIPDNVYKYKYGDCKGMANLTKSMLRHLGLNAHLCWTYSGNTCYWRGIPSISVYNHVICAVNLDDSFIFLDPTVNYSTLFEINEGIQGKESLIENGDNYLIKEIPATPFSANLLMVNNEIGLMDDKLMVEGNISLKGAIKKMFQYFLNHLRSDNKEDLVNFFITKTDNNFLIKEISTTPADSMTDKFDINYNMEISNTVLDIGDEILLTLDFYNEYRNSNIDSTRKFNFAFDSRMLNQHEIIFHIPDNMTVVGVPDSLFIEHPKFEFAGGYAVEDSLLIYRKNISIKNSLLTTGEFDEWNHAIDKLVKFYNEMVILKKQ